MKLNVCCGNVKIDGYHNIDGEAINFPDTIVDIKNKLPFADDSIEEIIFFHAIEHIENKFHSFILSEFWRVLEPNGLLLIAYPEFVKCASNYINNYKGMKQFWKNTLYGLQRYPGDYHVALMDSEELAEKLQENGFVDLEWMPEKNEPYNTIMKSVKGPAFPTYEELLGQSIFQGKVN